MHGLVGWCSCETNNTRSGPKERELYANKDREEFQNGSDGTAYCTPWQLLDLRFGENKTRKQQFYKKYRYVCCQDIDKTTDATINTCCKLRCCIDFS